MNLSDPIADMLTRIRNALKEAHPEVKMPSSNLKTEIARVLKDEGYISDYTVENSDGVKKVLTVGLKYLDGKPVIAGIKRISLASRRVYFGAKKIPRVLGGLGIVILSTPMGVVTGKTAKKNNVGGELLCKVW